MNRAGRLAMMTVAATLACACPGSGGARVGGGGGSGGSNDGSAAGLCEGIRPKIERLYRAEAEAKEPRRVEAAVADNTTMVMNDCARAPAKVAPCVNEVSSIAELERRCLVRLDDEGTEGEELKR